MDKALEQELDEFLDRLGIPPYGAERHELKELVGPYTDSDLVHVNCYTERDLDDAADAAEDELLDRIGVKIRAAIGELEECLK